MKIYANKRKYNLEYFVGKDMWVKVLRSWDITPVYMRILSVEESLPDGHKSYVVNWVDASDVDNSDDVYGDYWSDERIIDFIFEKNTYFFDDCTIVEPLQILSTDEILSIILEKHRNSTSDIDYSEGFIDDEGL